MRTLRIIGAFLLGLALMLAPASAAHAAPGGPNLPTDVIITKIEMGSSPIDMTEWPKAHDGTPITNIEQYFGTGSKPLENVTFKVYSVDQTLYNTMSANPSAYDTVAEVEATAATLVGTQVTGANGQVTFANLANGHYWFIEDLTVAGSPMVNAAVAVPFGISLPMVKGDGTYFGTGTDALHVYPKNTTGNEPEVDKDVTTVGNDSDSANVGDNVTWIIKPMLPADIATYQRLVFTDVIDTRLDYQGNVVVTNGGATMVAGTDYTLTQPTVGQAGGTLVVTFTPAGIAKLTQGENLQITFDTSINATAVVGQPIPNNVTLDYTNGSGVSGDPKDVPEDEQPEVWTGGKRFEKVDQATPTTKLGDAVFALQNEDGTAVNWTASLIAMNQAAINAGKFATAGGTPVEYTATGAGNLPVAGDPIYLMSATDGTFEIAGLQGAQAATDPKVGGTPVVTHTGNYLLEEVKAPAGYALLTAKIEFTVTKTSYWADPTIVTPVAADPQVVNNMKITIPPTGGIGTVLFTVAGLALMGGAAFGMRKRAAKA